MLIQSTEADWAERETIINQQADTIQSLQNTVAERETTINQQVGTIQSLQTQIDQPFIFKPQIIVVYFVFIII